MSSESWSIETFARLRPSNKPPRYSLDYDIEEIADSKSKRLVIEIPPETDSGLLHSNDEGIIGFNFNDIFNTDATQEQVFEHIAKQKVLDVFGGVNATVFAYGQTGSGKTYSIFGGDTYQDRGLIPRSLGQIFQEIKRRSNPEEEFTCKLSFTEVYKENLYDLLDPNKRHVPMEQWVPVQMFESEQGLMLRNVNVFEVDSEEKALNLFFMGNTNRITASTQMNNASSRSHAIFTVIVESKRLVENPLARKFATVADGNENGLPTSHEYLTGKLNLVDLAGSERMYKLQNSKNLISQAKSINLSLHFLEQVIISLRDSNSKLVSGKGHSRAQTHIPYRNSVLTSMLRDSLGGNCKSCFVLTVASERLHFEETVSTCRFGQRCGEVLVDVHVNKEITSDDELLEMKLRNEMLTKQLKAAEQAKEKLEEENAQLRDELAEAHAAAQPAPIVDATTVPPLRELSDDDHLFVSDTLGSLLTAIEDNMEVCRQQIGDPGAVVDENYFDFGFDATREMFYENLSGKDYTLVVEISQALVVLVHQLFKEKEAENRQMHQLASQLAAAGGGSSKSGNGDDGWPRRDSSEDLQPKTLTPMFGGRVMDDVASTSPIRVEAAMYETPMKEPVGFESDPNGLGMSLELSPVSVSSTGPTESLDVNYLVIPSPRPPPPPPDSTTPLSLSPEPPQERYQAVADLTGPMPLSRISYITAQQTKLLTNGAMFCKLPTSNKMLKSMLRAANASKQLRYVCVSHDLKYLKWKSFSTTNHKKERAYGQSQADADVDNYKYLNSPVPMGRGAVSAKSAESSFLALSSIDSVSLEQNPLQQGEMSKFALWGGGAGAAPSNNNCPVLVISGLDGGKVLRLEFFCSVLDGNRQTGSSSSKHDLTVMWLDALTAAIQQAQMIEKREKQLEAHPHRSGAFDHSSSSHTTTYNMVNSGYIKKKMFQRDLMSGVKK